MRNYVTDEEINRAKEVALLSYLQIAAPGELVKKGNGHYSTKTHDSIDISNGFWKQWSSGVGGKSAVDYLVKVEGRTFQEAVRAVNEAQGGMPSWDVRPTQSPPAVKKEFKLPERNNDNLRAMAYLKERGIHLKVITYCVQNGQLFEEAKTHNVVFVGTDKTGTPKYAFRRGTGTEPFKREATGSDKRYNFCIAANPNATTLHVYESAIDALSYCSIGELVGGDWKCNFHLSQGGVAPAALEQFLADHPNIKRVVLRYDNDVPGQEAAVKMQKMLTEKHGITTEIKPPLSGKDYNDFLQNYSAWRAAKRTVCAGTPAQNPLSSLPVSPQAKTACR